PLFRRMRFLYEIGESTDTSVLTDQCSELIDFISEFEMGGFYSKRIGKLLWPPSPPPARSVSIPFGANLQHRAYGTGDRIYTDVEYRNQLTTAQAQVSELIVELLRFQNWEGRNK
ncbi:MAG: hypothetical protein M3X11_25605, partial [Acidobacteriota bacterium]|nr:hypothetical protein [Acidobacteriota bacterium]